MIIELESKLDRKVAQSKLPELRLWKLTLLQLRF